MSMCGEDSKGKTSPRFLHTPTYMQVLETAASENYYGLRQ
jgi:hypothetical protein